MISPQISSCNLSKVFLSMSFRLIIFVISVSNNLKIFFISPSLVDFVVSLSFFKLSGKMMVLCKSPYALLVAAKYLSCIFGTAI